MLDIAVLAFTVLQGHHSGENAIALPAQTSRRQSCSCYLRCVLFDWPRTITRVDWTGVRGSRQAEAQQVAIVRQVVN